MKYITEKCKKIIVLRPGHHWKSLPCSLRPLAHEGARCPYQELHHALSVFQVSSSCPLCLAATVIM